MSFVTVMTSTGLARVGQALTLCQEQANVLQCVVDALAPEPGATAIASPVPIQNGVTKLLAPQPLSLDLPFEQDLELTRHFKQLSPALQSYLQPFYAVAVEGRLPISFRLSQMVMSNGELTMQLTLSRAGSAPSALRAATGGPNGPNTPGTFGLTVSLFGGAAVVVALDQGLIGSLIEAGVLPEEARSPVLFTSVMLIHQGLYKAGLVQKSPLQALGQVPTFMGFQYLAHGLLDFLGVEADETATMFGGLVLAGIPYALATQVPVLAEALETTSVIKGFQLGGLGPKAAVARLAVGTARLVGWAGIVDLGARGVADLIGHALTGDSDERFFDVIRLCQDIYNVQERGDFIAGAFGTFATFGDTVAGWFDSDFKQAYKAEIFKILHKLIGDSETFGESLEASVFSVLLRHTHLANKKWRIDWTGVQRELTEIYHNDGARKGIEAGYDLVRNYTGPFVSDADRLSALIDVDGLIQDQTKLRDHLRMRLFYLAVEKDQEMEQWARDNGLLVETRPDHFVFVDKTLTGQQEQERRRLVTERINLQYLEQALAL